ncbi:hypothetical protein HN682_01310 [Candidatus Peregrinibacteria bacterium]|jgi:hypothetical protein|nr:hypothetical protein [Candidatus Peregrinibacteria bacterium]
MADINSGNSLVGDNGALNSVNSLIMNPTWNRRTSSIPILSTAQDLTTTAADVGSEIACGGYDYAYVYMTTVMGASANDFRVTVFAKHESAGAEEIPMDDGFVTISGSTFTAPSTVAIPWFEQTEDVSADLLIRIALDNSVRYLQLQAHVSDDTGNDSTIATADVILGY